MRRTWADEFSGGSVLVVVSGLLLAVAGVASLATQPVLDPQITLAFGLLIALGELARVNLPGDRSAAPLGAAAALAYALLGDFRTGGTVVETDYGVLQVVAVTAVALLVGAIPHMAVGQAPRLESLARRVLIAGCAALLFRPLYIHGDLAELSNDRDWQLPALMVAIVLVCGLVDAVLAALARSGRDGTPFASAARDELRALLGIGSAIGATGVLIALAAGVMGYWALPLFALPLVVAQFSFRRYASIRATYDQTITALSRVTEVGGYTETGHAQRVAQLSVAIGREMGLSEDDIKDLRYAALMHDIGQLSLTDPISGGATSLIARDEQRRIAEYGAEVIRQSGMDRVAHIVVQQTEPFRRPGQPFDANIPVASRIIRVANAYDDFAGGSMETQQRLYAIGRLREGAAEEYDPHVVDIASRVVERTMLVDA
jgi:HD superfamily phosphodiesterase